MKLLFLDIDGVLNSNAFFWETDEEPGIHGLDPEAIGVLNEILAASGAKVVISSTWRKSFDYDELVAHLVAAGIRGDFIGATQNVFTYVSRGPEIHQWLRGYAAKLKSGEVKEPIEGIVCLDDASDMLEMQPWTVSTTWELGLQPEHLDKALEILGKPWTDEESPEND